MKPSKGETPLRRANLLHRDLPWSQHQLLALVERLLAMQLCARRFTTAQVRAIVGALDPAEVEEDAPDVVTWLQSQKKG